MKALVIAPQPFFSARGTPFSVYYRTLVLAELGVTVDLLTYGSGHDVDIPGVRIVRIPRLPGFDAIPIGPSIRKGLLDLLLLVRTLGLLLVHRYDFVHAHEEAVFFARMLKPLFRFKLVYDMHSSLPQQLINFEFSRSRLLIGLFDRLERSCLAAADAVITICPDLADRATRQVRDPERHFLIENSIFDPVRYASSSPSEAAASAEIVSGALQGRRLVLYAGTLESYQGIDLLIRAFRVVRDEVHDAFLLILGGTPQQVTRYASLVGEIGLEDDCRLTGRVDPSTARRSATAADLLVSPRISGTNTPLKLYEQLASGIPLVATNIHSHTQVLDESVAFLAEPTPRDLGKKMVQALTDAEGRRERRDNARALYRRKYSRAAYVAKMCALIERLG